MTSVLTVQRFLPWLWDSHRDGEPEGQEEWLEWIELVLGAGPLLSTTGVSFFLDEFTGAGG